MPASTAAEAHPAESRQRSAPEPHGIIAAMATAMNSKRSASCACGVAEASPCSRNGPSPSTPQVLSGGVNGGVRRTQRSGKRRAHERKDEGGDGSKRQIAEQRLRGGT